MCVCIMSGGYGLNKEIKFFYMFFVVVKVKKLVEGHQKYLIFF